MDTPSKNSINLSQSRIKGVVQKASVLFGTLLLLHCLYLVSVKVTHLGVIIPAVISIGLIAAPWIVTPFCHWMNGARWRYRLWRIGQFAFAIWLITLLAYFFYLHRSSTQIDDDFQPKVIVILGSSTPNAQPSPTLAERLKLGHKLAQKFPNALLVVSGGVDFRQTISEAKVMADYLAGLGLSSSRILIEDKSTSTYENLMFTARLLRSQGIMQDPPTVLVTSDFHTLRAGWIASKASWRDVKTAGSITPLYLRFNAWTREYFACLSGLVLGEF